MNTNDRDRPLRIAMVSEHASPLASLGGVDAGGQNVHVASLAIALARQGHEVVVATRRDDRSLPAEVEMHPGVVVHHVDAGPPVELPKDELLPHMAAFGAELAAAWTSWRPDVVHTHFWMSGVAGTAAAMPLGVPVVHTFHALGTVKARHQGPDDTSPPDRVMAECALLDRCHVIATCRDEARELEMMGSRAGAVSIVPCGVDTERFRPISGPRHRPRIVAAGRLVPRKGLEDLVVAMASVPGAELWVVGGPAPEYVALDPEITRLLAVATDAGVDDRVRFTGRADRARIAEVLAGADVVACVPWYEPFGLVPLEAMACGVPVVATAVGGLMDSVRHGVTGLHVPPRRPDRIARALRCLLDDRALRRRMGAEGRRIVEREYTWTTVAAQTAAVYREVVERRGSEVVGG